MFTQATFMVSNPEDPQFKGVPESLEQQYHQKILKKLRIVGMYESRAVHVDFRNEAVLGHQRPCGARDVIVSRRVCVITLRGLMLKKAVRVALAKVPFDESRPVVDIKVSWRLQKPAVLQRAA